MSAGTELGVFHIEVTVDLDFYPMHDAKIRFSPEMFLNKDFEVMSQTPV